MIERECPNEDHLLLLDELSCQMSDRIKDYLRSRRVLPVYIPGREHTYVYDETYVRTMEHDHVCEYINHDTFLRIQYVHIHVGGCTDVLQPVDHHFGALLKKVMNEFYKVELELNFAEWRDYTANKTLSQSNRRMYMGLWLNMAWGVLRTQGSFISKTFANTVLITKAGHHALKLTRLNRVYKPRFT